MASGPSAHGCTRHCRENAYCSALHDRMRWYSTRSQCHCLLVKAMSRSFPMIDTSTVAVRQATDNSHIICIARQHIACRIVSVERSMSVLRRRRFRPSIASRAYPLRSELALCLTLPLSGVGSHPSKTRRDVPQKGVGTCGRLGREMGKTNCACHGYGKGSSFRFGQ